MNTRMLAAIRCSMILLVPALAYAGSAQWNLNPAQPQAVPSLLQTADQMVGKVE